MSNIAVPDYANVGDSMGGEPAEAAEERSWVLNLLWSIFSPGTHAVPHPLDWSDVLGNQDVRNFNFFLAYIARILDGRPLKRATFLFSPRGRNSKNALEALLRNVFGSYAQSCKNSIFLDERKLDESNSAISLSRESARWLIGQEVDTDSPWCNATFKRRADCARVYCVRIDRNQP